MKQLLSELDLAIAVQKALLTIEIPNCHCGHMVVKNEMGHEVGGDFYYFQSLGQEQVAFGIGDVMGHGTGAALIMSMIMGALKADRTDHRRPERVVSHINNMLLRLGELVETPITCSLFYGVVDMPSGLLLYINAGHPYPIVYHRSAKRLNHLSGTTMLLGVAEGVKDEMCHQFEQGDRLLLFTDGLTETKNESLQQYGQHRLEEMVKKCGQDELETLAEKVFSVTEEFSQGLEEMDDRTLVGIDFNNMIVPGI